MPATSSTSTPRTFSTDPPNTSSVTTPNTLSSETPTTVTSSSSPPSQQSSTILTMPPCSHGCSTEPHVMPLCPEPDCLTMGPNPAITPPFGPAILTTSYVMTEKHDHTTKPTTSVLTTTLLMTKKPDSTTQTTQNSLTIPPLIITEKHTTSTNRPLCLGGADWNVWSAWSTCSSICGFGVAKRSRSCHNTARCDYCIGYNTEEKGCLNQICNCQWQDWGTWSGCSGNNGRGTRTRQRQCLKSNGCSRCEGNYTEQRNCVVQPFPCRWKEWTGWSTCPSKNGIRRRRRQCDLTERCSSCIGIDTEHALCSKEQYGTEDSDQMVK